MFSISEESFGYRFGFAGTMDVPEIKAWLDEVKGVVSKSTGAFGVLIDMRDLEPLAADVKNILADGQRFCKENGMNRTAVIVESKVVRSQFMRIAWKTGIYEWERYIDASVESDWEKIAIEWIVDCIDPDA